MRLLPLVCLFLVGCGLTSSTPVATETDSQGASRVFALARDLESARKTKQAIAAYRQIIDHFPSTPEARNAFQRITISQRTAIRTASTRRSK